MRRIRRLLRQFEALFADNENAVTPQFYGYRLSPPHKLRHFAASLSKPYLQDMRSYYPPLGFLG